MILITKLITVFAVFVASFFVLALVLMLGYGITVVIYDFCVFIIEQSRKSMGVRNTIISILYTLMDMGPSISAVAFVAIIIATPATVLQLIMTFIFGLLVKELARIAKNKFYEKLDLKDTDENKRSSLLERALSATKKEKRR